MSVNKYANLPDIDTSQDVYETEDSFPTHAGAGDSSEDESAAPTRQPTNGGARAEGVDIEGLDSSSLVSADEAGRKFRKAERKRDLRLRSIYAYPPSSPPSPSSPSHARPLATRMRTLQAELDSLEAELADPSNPLLHGDEHGGAQIDPGELMRGLVDVRGRLDKVKKAKEGRGRLVGVILNRDKEVEGLKRDLNRARSKDAAQSKDVEPGEGKDKTEAKDDEEDNVALAELDRRVGELEDLIGSSSVALDETSPLPAPLLPMLTKLNTQLTILTQPRHLDSISRRLKLLISDLDRLMAAQHTQAGGRRPNQQSAHAPAVGAPSSLQEQLLPLLARLAPHLPHLPHLLTRMRTLSGLHAAAADVQGALGTLEAEQRRTHGRLDVLSTAVEGVEKSLEENAQVVRGNVGGLEERIEMLVSRLDALGKHAIPNAASDICGKVLALVYFIFLRRQALELTMPAPSTSPISEKRPLLQHPLPSKDRTSKPVLVIHGGAGTMTREGSTPERRELYKKTLRDALLKGNEVLQRGGEAMDAAVAAVSILEDCPLFNSGKGAVFNVAGKNELESSIMLSKSPASHPNIPRNRRGFSLTLLTTSRNPSQAVRLLYLAPDSAPHPFLSGMAAEEIAHALGAARVDPSYFFTKARWNEHRRGLGLPKEPVPYHDHDHDQNWEDEGDIGDYVPKGTVGAVALDERGCIATVTSTGGRTNKLVGRIGDTPHMGSGFWAEEWSAENWVKRAWRKITRKGGKQAVGISGTGDGDYFIRYNAAASIAYRMRFLGESLKKASETVVKTLGENEGLGGVIALDEQGNYTLPMNSSGMYRGVITAEEANRTSFSKSFMSSSSSHKRLLKRLVIAVHVLVSVVLFIAARLPSFDSSAELVLDPAWPTSLLRWDAFHFAHIARDGYTYEYEYAFFPGTPLVMGFSAKLLEIANITTGNNFIGVLVAGTLLSAAVSVDTALTLYDLTCYHFPSPAFALLATLLSLLSSSPATLRHAPYAEPFFTYLSYKGMLHCARKRFLYASFMFALASAFRSNGIVLAGYIVWGMLIEPALSVSASLTNIISVKILLKMISCALLSALPLAPFLFHQYNGYVAFCTAGEQRPWCSNRLPFIYSFVQSTYWDIGLFRYWTLQQSPNILLAAPILVLLFHASILHIRRALIPFISTRLQSLLDSSRVPKNSEKYAAREDIVSDPLLTPSLAPHAIHTFILSTTLLVSAHTQIALRLASALPFTYWAAARLLVDKPQPERRLQSAGTDPATPSPDSGKQSILEAKNTNAEMKDWVPGRVARWWVGWSVLWGVTSLITWAVFLPPA
ncbi:hypothetical protein EW145_g3162 [Phellinidium pouzarii]|uniref:GPI mannosyltransferase 2 n=1 Tax=Phellinidium pouzarii TaxID=167371 RepID=A0A4S4L9M7_9AGAM|nr:hypothetical protein EW145_g3162 [Phellinidium pouzarii]